MIQLILASQSASRRAMLTAAGVSFEGMAARIDENAVKAGLRARGLSAKALALNLAEAKAHSLVAHALDALILGCDQTLELNNGNLLDKATDATELAQQLQLMSGKTHHLHSAAVIIEKGEVAWRQVESVALTIRPLSESFIADYVARVGADVFGCVGGYQIEGLGVQLFEQIEGSHFAILGLPLLPLLGFLRMRGVLMS